MNGMLLASSTNANIFRTPEGKICKIIKADYAGVYPYYLFCQHHVRHPNILSPLEVKLVDGEIHVFMSEGLPLPKVHSPDLKQLLMNILDALVYFEQLGLIHGDIKPANIVLHEGRYCLIDFDLLPQRENNIQLSQSFADVYGCALRQKIRHPAYNNFHQALYALACTLEIAKRTPKHFPKRERGKSLTLTVHGMQHVILVSETVKNMYEDSTGWVNANFQKEWRPFVLKLIGAERFTSFLEARNHPLLGGTLTKTVTPLTLLPLQLPNWSEEGEKPAPITIFGTTFAPCPRVGTATRRLYNYACLENLPSLTLFFMYNNFYRYNYLLQEEPGQDEETKFKYKLSFLEACKYFHLQNYQNSFVRQILAIDKGRIITEYPGTNLDTRLLLEYLVPGSWLETAHCDYDLEELFNVISNFPRAPKRVFLHGRVCILTRKETDILHKAECEEVDLPEDSSSL